MKKRKQLISYEEAIPAKSQHKKPCSDCPWGRGALAGWLGSMSPQAWIDAAHGEAVAECHAHTGVQCAGMAIYRANVCKTPRYPETLQLPADHKSVFSTPWEFLEHHTVKETA